MATKTAIKHKIVFQALERQIAEGAFANGRRLPSETELARRFGVSRPTAARALRDLQSLGIIDRRVGSGSYLTSTASNAHDLSQRKFGLLVPGLGDTEILDPICNEITRFSQSLGAAVLWGDAVAPVTTADDALALCRQYIDSRVDGVFFAPIENSPDREAVNKRIARMLQEANIAVVLLDRDIVEFPAHSQFDLVGIYNFSAGFVLTQHLIQQGNRDFRFLARPSYPATTDLRLAGCREALFRAGITQPRALAWFGEPTDAAFVTEMLRPRMPDAIICSNDQTAARLIQSLSGRGIRLPGDVRVAGFDDVRYATLLTVPLTTIHQPCRAIGRAAVSAMLERIQYRDRAARQIHLPFSLILRESSTCPQAVRGSQKQTGRKVAAGSSRTSAPRTLA